MTNGLSHCYHLDESIISFKQISSDLHFFLKIFDEIPLSKQDSPSRDVAYRGITSGVMLFAYVP